MAPRTRHLPRAAAVALTVALVLAGACKPRNDGNALRSTGGEDFDPQFKGVGSYPIWSFDPGPDPTTEPGRRLIDLNSSIPYFPGLSDAVYGAQMFRPAFGPIPWRLVQDENTVQILFIGQDGTHIAEAAGRPATAGFGGRAQDLAAYFGVNSGAAFINTYAFTIRWQYGAFDTPMLMTKDGRPELSYGSFTGNPVWLLTQDQQSPIVKWRNQLIDWIIRRNSKSLKMIVLFGGAARDAAGAYIVSKGSTVAPRTPAEKIAAMQVKIPEFELKGAGSNRQTAVPLDINGNDMFVKFAGQQLDYKQTATPGSKAAKARAAFRQAFNTDEATRNKLLAEMALPEGGLSGSGMLHPAQMGGYDLARGIQIVNPDMNFTSEVGTISLRNLKIDETLTIDHDILVTQLPHPTALSTMSKEDASAAVKRGLEGFQKYVQQGWAIEPETKGGYRNAFAAGEAYSYSRSDMGTEYYDFGAPNSRMVNVSTASRDGANVIIFGTRDRVQFDKTKIQQMTEGAITQLAPEEMPPVQVLYIARAISTAGTVNPGPNNRRYTFDPGPTVEIAKLMKTSLPHDPSSAFVQARAVNGDFGHYRGTFTGPDVVILADPAGDDDLITARALTGSRGPYLHGMMRDLGVNENYLVIKTAPYSNYSDGDPESNNSRMWRETVEMTKPYREAVLKKVFELAQRSGKPRLILADGPWAAQEMARIFPGCPIAAPGACPLVAIQRNGDSPDAGLAEAGAAIRALPGFENANFSLTMRPIPRSHLTYYARNWEGTSGDRVITSDDPKYKGVAFAEVAPKWAFTQKYLMTAADMEGCVALLSQVGQQRVRLGEEKVPSYRTRIKSSQPFDPRARCEKAGQGGTNSPEGASPQTQVQKMENAANGPFEGPLQHLPAPL
jgi:hypothetical protein